MNALLSRFQRMNLCSSRSVAPGAVGKHITATISHIRPSSYSPFLLLAPLRCGDIVACQLNGRQCVFIDRAIEDPMQQMYVRVLTPNTVPQKCMYGNKRPLRLCNAACKCDINVLCFQVPTVSSSNIFS